MLLYILEWAAKMSSRDFGQGSSSELSTDILIRVLNYRGIGN